MHCENIFYLVLNIAYFCEGFFPRQPPHWKTKTHYDITNTGTLQAIASYVHEKKMTNSTSPSSALDDFFGTDYNSKTEMFKTINAVRISVADTQEEKKDVAYVHCHAEQIKLDYNSKTEMFKTINAVRISVTDTQEEKKDVAYVHCHAEQIKLAHNHVIACRDGIRERAGNIDELRSKLGECLYTVQSFYSNTNWVEMSGKIPYYDFGVKGKQLMSVATQDEDTCLDMPNIAVDCKDNLMTLDKLTSGYHHGRGNKKPSKPLGSKTGKCSHGGPKDESRKFIAKCGINKETTIEELSPHYHLHDAAYFAAVEATKHFLIADDTGILKVLGDDIFDSLFHIKKRKPITLAFAVDYSGSMSEEIAAVKSQIIQLVTSTMGSDNEPADYVLSLFSDPVNLNEVFSYTTGSEMINKISKVTVNDGGDCPELAADGILKAIEHSRQDSTVFAFTDADAKDYNRTDEVRRKANAKKIKITTLLTGRCSKRRRRETRDQQVSFFESLALSTGGTVYHTTKEDFGTVLEEAIEVVFPTSEIIMESYDWTLTMADKKLVIVDESVQVLKIIIKGSANVNDVDFIHPNGTVELFATSSASIIVTNGQIIMSFQKFLPGIYNMHRTSKISLSINITAQSYVKVEGDMLERTESSSLVILKGSPVVGYNYSYIATVYNLDNGTCNDLYIVSLSGNIIDSLQTEQISSDIELLCSADIFIPNEAFQIKLNLSDGTGATFYRTLSTIYKPTSVKLTVKAGLDALVGEEHYVNYEISNTGTTTDTYNVSITNLKGFGISPLSYQHTINASQTINGSFIMNVTTTGIFSYSVMIASSSTTEVKQLIKRSFVATNVERPSCQIIMVNGECPASSMNTANCSNYMWQSKLEITFSETKLDGIFGGSLSQLTFDANFTELTNGPLTVNLSSNCCNPSVTVSIVDIDGYIAQCQLDFSEGRIVESVEPIEDVVIKPTGKSEISSIYGIVVAVTVCVIIAFLVIVAGVITNSMLRRGRAKPTDKINSKQDQEPNRKFSFANRLIKFKPAPATSSEIEWS